MERKHDWIPTREQDFVDLIHIWNPAIRDTATQTLYGWGAAACLKLEAALDSFLDARSVYQSNTTTERREEKDAAKTLAIAAMRVFARENIRFNDMMSAAQKRSFGVSAQDNDPSPVIIPQEGPGSKDSTNSAEPGIIYVRYIGPKPAGVERIEMAYGFFASPPENAKLLPEKTSFTKNPWVGEFLDKRGKTFYYSLRYLGTNDQVSHWSAIKEVIVP